MTQQSPLQLDTLREVTARERNQDSLQEIPPRFWKDAEEYLDILSDRIRDVHDGGPAASAPEEVVRLREERETAFDLLDALAEKRKAKLVDMATFAASDMAVDEGPMTPTEEELFEEFVETLTDASLVPTVEDEVAPDRMEVRN
jgi:DNA replication initiation complex subunit (GINS family)